MVEKIKKYDNLILGIAVFIFSSIMIFQVGISTDDELWNFQNIYKMVNGYPIYQEGNVIITPIFFWIGEILFKLLGANYFIYRLFDACIYSSMILIIYNILKQLKIEKRNALMYTLIVHYFIHTIVLGGANYNTLALTFVLLGIYIALKYYGHNKFIVLNGIVIYLILFTKQNIGAYYLIATIVMQFLLRKNNTKIYKDIIKQIGITAILSIFTLGILAINGNLLDFVNYAFLGIGEFGSNNIAIEVMSIVYFIVAIITNICAIIIYKKIANDEQKRNITIFTSIGILMILIVYPIVNAFHVMIAILPSAVLLMYLANIVTKELMNKTIVNVIIGFMIIIFSLIVLKAGIVIINNNPFSGDYNTPYYGVYIKEDRKISLE